MLAEEKREEAILFVVRYFDLFDYPLTAEEIWHWLCLKEKDEHLLSLMDKPACRLTLVRLAAEGKISAGENFYFLPGREFLPAERKRKEVIAIKKMRKACFLGSLLAYLPQVKMIAIVSDVAYFNSKEDADIDFFIVCRRGRVWSARFWCALLMKILGQRPGVKTHKDKACLSYFVSEDALNLEQTKVGDPDYHLIYLAAQSLLVYQEEGVWREYIQANSWIRRYLINFDYEQGSAYEFKIFFPALKKLLRFLSGFLTESFLRRLQLKIMPKHLRDGWRRGDQSVIIGDSMLKLHSNDKRREINSKLFADKI